ncbi:hypothetical protein T439DRAFT_377061 [Meredithblackwellia eburnea MCA 4105]
MDGIFAGMSGFFSPLLPPSTRADWCHNGGTVPTAAQVEQDLRQAPKSFFGVWGKQDHLISRLRACGYDILDQSYLQDCLNYKQLLDPHPYYFSTLDSKLQTSVSEKYLGSRDSFLISSFKHPSHQYNGNISSLAKEALENSHFASTITSNFTNVGRRPFGPSLSHPPTHSSTESSPPPPGQISNEEFESWFFGDADQGPVEIVHEDGDDSGYFELSSSDGDLPASAELDPFSLPPFSLPPLKTQNQAQINSHANGAVGNGNGGPDEEGSGRNRVGIEPEDHRLVIEKNLGAEDGELRSLSLEVKDEKEEETVSGLSPKEGRSNTSKSSPTISIPLFLSNVPVVLSQYFGETPAEWTNLDRGLMKVEHGKFGVVAERVRK